MNKYILMLVAFFVLSTQVLAEETLKYNKELDGFEYPFEVSTFEFNSQQQVLKMRYMDVGDKDSDKIIVLLHGKNFSGYYWEKVAKDLLKKKYRVIMPDQIGFGKSSKPDYYQYSFGQLGLNTKSLLDSLGIKKAVIVGHSMGGMVAATFAVNHSEYVDKLILMNPLGLEDYGKYAQVKDVNFFYKRELAKTLKGAKGYQKKNYYDGDWDPEYDKLLIPLKGMLASEDWPVVAWNNALTYGPIFSENVVARLPDITSETFLIIGTRDKTGPGRGWKKEGVTRKLGEYNKLGKNAQKLIKGSTLLELEGLGHMTLYEDHARFMEALNTALDK
ncbi:alpha/beta hydrolase [Cocleimonas flava]|uniref:Pimeloyl-ACP methyl ester carboxylesterase n=1 Tax=Cocleimonas flava TaxID=634765 RepID=A0A4R1F063_9GAMM|nr:alpha/beta hydrolase [Cocleimonas flava]TCJ84888.1 pimeloyl-ACP methyl ester carboxylesterase [Cocleimonas flava]